MTVNMTNIEGGGVTAAKGFKAGGIHAGFRKDPNRFDLAMVEADELCTAAGVFTQNVFCAPCVTFSKSQLGSGNAGVARAVVINSGVANAATGTRGLEDAARTAQIAADVVGCAAEDVLIASTGVIGVFLPMEPFETGIPVLHEKVSVQGGNDAARAIMTTDTVSKEVAFSYVSAAPGYEGCTFTVGGMSKGSGMIMPNMATMIAVLTTDAPLTPQAAHSALVAAVNESFNKITVDGDTSTNDTCLLMASGKAAPGAPSIADVESAAYAEFAEVLKTVCVTLAKIMAADGEGASKLVTVQIEGAASDEDADLAARTVANSPLVKTAVAGHDANWGRIAGALGRSGASFKQEDVDIDIMGLPVCRKGMSVAFDEDEALRRFEADEIVLYCNLHAGECSTTMWTCDFTHDYITINGDYRT
ncbi:MAG: bifunctional glutamate N-acetyltransferase/amino-acid acetyltransferase ArgJ [Eggerthellales bacterium]|nr:bifunctional glutamate N-acetyltransferase/amino-acid acetyltransferase ArgJ [Eggerthellales bacterium]